MDHINISQTCDYCLIGKKVFRVDLKLYDAEGKLLAGTRRMKIFRFICQFCQKESSLDFYNFSHPDLICHLKRIHEQYIKTKETLNELYILFNKTIY